ncbi:hypothetical protein E2C01_068073 [Portunus trituberculatus]|uniref:Uncharacterized protein n=1 Tax=Portunus trituberculatus TaxID=210409 RepID=A0A5B7HVB8_PORTR|nr:hypothetical protein [Portunus trituberculatus]
MTRRRKCSAGSRAQVKYETRHEMPTCFAYSCTSDSRHELFCHDSPPLLACHPDVMFRFHMGSLTPVRCYDPR